MHARPHVTNVLVDDVRAAHAELVARGGPVTTAILDDTCGNLIQLVSFA